MGETTKISWTDATFNPWIGCSKVSPGCANCYAERDWDKRRHRATWGPMGTRSVTSEENWQNPLRWDRKAAKEGKRVRVFCASLADVFEDWPGQVQHFSGVKMWLMNQPNGHDFCWGAGHVLDDPTSGRALKLSDLRHRLFRLIDQTPHLDWLLVTKRPENIMAMWPNRPCGSAKVCSRGDGIVCAADSCDLETGVMAGTHRPNVWLLTSTEDQQRADERIPELLKCRDLAPVLGVSAEPLLGPIDLRLMKYRITPRLDWVITGGESGPNARPCHPDWVRSIRDQCQEAGVAFHHKQWGEWSPLNGTGRPLRDCEEEITPFVWVNRDGKMHTSGNEPDALMVRQGRKQTWAMLDGREWREFPTTIHSNRRCS